MKTCSVCGSHDFDLQDGKYYCQECNTQTQETEEVTEAEYGVVFGRAIASGITHQSFAVENFEAWLSVEGFNIVLKKQVEALINLGASGNLMHTVLQLWAKFLQKSQVAFVTDEEDWLPKLSTIPRYRDYEVIRGDLMLSGCCESEINDAEYKMVWRNQRRTFYELKRERKPPARLEPVKNIKIVEELDCKEKDFSRILEVTTDEEIEDPVNVDDPVNEENPEDGKIADSNDVLGLFSEAARKKLETMDARKRSVYWNNRHKGLHPDSLTLLHTICFCYAGILLNQDHITLSDILRWICQCKIPYTSAWTVLPKSMLPQRKDYLIFQTNLLPNRNQIEFMTEKMMNFIDVESIPRQPFEMTVLRVFAELNLPLVLVKYARQLVYDGPLILNKLFTEDWKVGKMVSLGLRLRGNQEFAIIVLCLMVLKMIFGLDGKREYICSQAAKLANNEQKTYFVWEEWFDFASVKLKTIKALHSAQFRTENSEPNVFVDVDWFHQYYWHTVSSFRELEIKSIRFKKRKKKETGVKKGKKLDALSSNEETETSGDEMMPKKRKGIFSANASDDDEDLVAVEKRSGKVSKLGINVNMRKMISNLSEDRVEFSQPPLASSFPLSEISPHSREENFNKLKVLKTNKKLRKLWILNRDNLGNNFLEYYKTFPVSFRLICDFVCTIYNCDCQELCDELSKMENIVYNQLRRTRIIK